MGRDNKYTKKEKRSLKIQRDLDKIYKEMRDLEWQELDKPIKYGYEKWFVIRKDVLRSKEGPWKEKALDIVAKVVWCKNKKFIHSYKSPRMLAFVNQEHEVISNNKKGLKILLNPGKKEIYPKDFEALDPRIKKYFIEVKKTHKWNGVEYSMYALNLYPHELDTRIKVNYLTHRREFRPDLESREAELDAEYRILLNSGVGNYTWRDWWTDNSAKRQRILWKNAKSRLLITDDYNEVMNGSAVRDLEI